MMPLAQSMDGLIVIGFQKKPQLSALALSWGLSVSIVCCCDTLTHWHDHFA